MIVDAGQHAPQNAMQDLGEIAWFHDRCSNLMRELLDALAARPPGRPPLGFWPMGDLDGLHAGPRAADASSEASPQPGDDGPLRRRRF